MDPYDSKGARKPVTFPVAQKPPFGRDNYIEPWDSKSQPRDMKSRHRDDYKDPWDSKAQESLPKSSFEEDDDYNTPYDAGLFTFLFFLISYVYTYMHTEVSIQDLQLNDPFSF